MREVERPPSQVNICDFRRQHPAGFGFFVQLLQQLAGASAAAFGVTILGRRSLLKMSQVATIELKKAVESV
jgi:hypothetical protein